MQKMLLILKEKMLPKELKLENYWKVRNHWHYTGNLKFNVSNEVPVVFHDGSNYDYHFIRKELEKKCEGEFECLGENTEKYKTVSV